MLVDNNFASKEETNIKATKTMTKDQEHFTFTQPRNFNKA